MLPICAHCGHPVPEQYGFVIKAILRNGENDFYWMHRVCFTIHREPHERIALSGEWLNRKEQI